ncbi:hypothetical protein [Shewanella sp. MBTL60-007]|uniref:hypothetical protein n=1 Tax=Shewanella sp. MBTL60-007 TaxID=2815911 RepID=UPI001BC7D90B|nr:hypothetical protein [Shewanella sp. MBTL60-007]GIU22147.1 hypothetical protein TUM3792_23880 [Shewanella sp. MBTL60-007]
MSDQVDMATKFAEVELQAALKNRPRNTLTPKAAVSTAMLHLLMGWLFVMRIVGMILSGSIEVRRGRYESVK